MRRFFRSWPCFLLIAAFHLFLISCIAQEAQPGHPPDSNPTLTFPQFANTKSIHMVAYGDSRFTDPSVTSGTNPRIRKWLAQRVAEEDPQVVLLTGDTPYTGAKASDWQDFQDETAGWRTAHILQLPTTGNHEVYGGREEGIANYLKNFPDIAGHRYYSAVLGNVEVISLDCTLPSDTAGDQARWFAAQLDHLPRETEFLLILYHIPWMADEQSQIFVNLPSKDSLVYRDILDSRLGHLHAKVIVFNGHIHNYERFERRGVEYVVTGGGGAEPYPILLRGRADLYRDTSFPVYNYLTLDVSAHQLHAVMWKVKDPQAGQLNVAAMDQFTVSAIPQKPATRKRTKPLPPKSISP